MNLHRMAYFRLYTIGIIMIIIVTGCYNSNKNTLINEDINEDVNRSPQELINKKYDEPVTIEGI
jgi:hypothetical protein